MINHDEPLEERFFVVTWQFCRLGEGQVASKVAAPRECQEMLGLSMQRREVQLQHYPTL